MTLRDINLVDPGILKRRHTRRHLLLWAGCLILSLALIGGFYQYRFRVILSGKSDLAPLGQMHTDLGTKIGEIKRIQEELEKLRQQQNIIETLIKKQPYYKVLQQLSGIMNEYTWLTQLAVDRREDKRIDSHLQLNGFSLSNEKLGDLLNLFSSDPMFTGVELKYVRESGRAPSNRETGEAERKVEFQIVCDIFKG